MLDYIMKALKQFNLLGKSNFSLFLYKTICLAVVYGVKASKERRWQLFPHEHNTVCKGILIVHIK